MTTPRRLAFFINLDGGLWTGGLSYYKNLFCALRAVVSPADFTLIGLIPQRDPLYEPLLSELDEVHVLPMTSFLGRAFEKGLLQIPYKIRFLLPFETVLSKQSRRANADILFLRSEPGYHFRIPTLSWFPDFQYLHYPEMFSPAEVAMLDDVLKSIANQASRMILSSEDVKEDFLRVVPEYADKVRVLPFVSCIDSSVYTQNPLQICDQYHLPEKFFHLPNQLWRHKNHRTVLDALVIARHKNPNITIVSTGMLSDYRDPRYSSELLTEISRTDNRENFIFLGLVPHSHLYAIMRQSLAVIQPSLFEGWSTIVEEVKSLGKTILLSDLPVHREQNPPSAIYFSPTDPHELAEMLSQLYETKEPGPDMNLEIKARRDLAERVNNFGNQFLKIAVDAIELCKP